MFGPENPFGAAAAAHMVVGGGTKILLCNQTTAAVKNKLFYFAQTQTKNLFADNEVKIAAKQNYFHT